MALSTRPGLRLKIYLSIFVKQADIDRHLLLYEIRRLAPLPIPAGLIEPSLRKRLDPELRVQTFRIAVTLDKSRSEP